MSLIQMSISGAIMVLAVIVIRALAINRLPKKTFIVLWGIVLLRLLIPFSIPSPVSAYSLANAHISSNQGTTGLENINLSPIVPVAQPTADTMIQGQRVSGISPYVMVWGIVMIAFVLFFAISYVKCRREFRESLPIKSDFLTKWLNQHQLARRIEIRQSSRICAPLTYGIFKPIILMPKNTNWGDTKQIEYILAHEFIHIRRFDAATKLLLTAAFCIHWFNPLVWAMYILANRDIELSCDETIVRSFGEPIKSAYALTLISMEEKKNSLTPLCNNFSKNAIEERITAIMKLKKTSLIALLVAFGLIIGVTVTLATSAAALDTKTTSVPNTNFSKSEYDQLLALRFDGYEKMTIQEYQQKVWTMRDTAEYMELLERFSQDAQLYEMRYTNDTASFLFNTLIPLTAEKWQSWNFDSYVIGPSNRAQGEDAAILEYEVSLTISDATGVTVGEYQQVRKEIMDELQEYFQSQTIVELQSQDTTYDSIAAEVERLSEQWNSSALQVEISFDFQPLSALDAETLKMISDEVEQSIALYVPFGINYEIDEISGQVSYYWNKKQIRGIYDELKGSWITNSAGTDSMEEGTKELIAEYKDQKLVGLREATAEEQEEWNRIRSQVSYQLEEDPEQRPYLYATQADYESLLKLKTPDYQNQSVSSFNQAVLDWANEDYERNERINVDRAWNDFNVSLTDEELSFITLTCMASGEENAKLVQSHYKGVEKEDPVLGGISLMKEANDKDRLAWANLFYILTYHISDETELTVGERDYALAGVMSEIQQYWDNTDIDTLLTMDEDQILENLKKIIKKYSNSLIKITLKDDTVTFECMSEPIKKQ